MNDYNKETRREKENIKRHNTYYKNKKKVKKINYLKRHKYKNISIENNSLSNIVKDSNFKTTEYYATCKFIQKSNRNLTRNKLKFLSNHVDINDEAYNEYIASIHGLNISYNVKNYIN